MYAITLNKQWVAVFSSHHSTKAVCDDMECPYSIELGSWQSYLSLLFFEAMKYMNQVRQMLLLNEKFNVVVGVSHKMLSTFMRELNIFQIRTAHFPTASASEYLMLGKLTFL